MIICDASAVTEILVRTPLGLMVEGDLKSRGEPLVAPHLLDVEVVSALRGLVAGGRIEAHRIQEILERLSDFPAERHPHLSLLQRAWELRHNFTVYDAVYIALAEATGGVLYTTDEKLRKGHRAKVRYFGGWVQ